MKRGRDKEEEETGDWHEGAKNKRYENEGENKEGEEEGDKDGRTDNEWGKWKVKDREIGRRMEKRNKSKEEKNG